MRLLSDLAWNDTLGLGLRQHSCNTHQTPSCFLGQCHPGRNSLVSRPGAHQSTAPSKHRQQGLSICPEPRPVRKPEQMNY